MATRPRLLRCGGKGLLAQVTRGPALPSLTLLLFGCLAASITGTDCEETGTKQTVELKIPDELICTDNYMQLWNLKLNKRGGLLFPNGEAPHSATMYPTYVSEQMAYPPPTDRRGLRVQPVDASKRCYDAYMPISEGCLGRNYVVTSLHRGTGDASTPFLYFVNANRFEITVSLINPVLKKSAKMTLGEESITSIGKPWKNAPKSFLDHLQVFSDHNFGVITGSWNSLPRGTSRPHHIVEMLPDTKIFCDTKPITKYVVPAMPKGLNPVVYLVNLAPSPVVVQVTTTSPNQARQSSLELALHDKKPLVPEGLTILEPNKCPIMVVYYTFNFENTEPTAMTVLPPVNRWRSRALVYAMRVSAAPPFDDGSKHVALVVVAKEDKPGMRALNLKSGADVSSGLQKKFQDHMSYSSASFVLENEFRECLLQHTHGRTFQVLQFGGETISTPTYLVCTTKDFCAQGDSWEIEASSMALLVDSSSAAGNSSSSNSSSSSKAAGNSTVSASDDAKNITTLKDTSKTIAKVTSKPIAKATSSTTDKAKKNSTTSGNSTTSKSAGGNLTLAGINAATPGKHASPPVTLPIIAVTLLTIFLAV